MKCMSYSQFFEVIANPTRLKIIESLIDSPKCVSDICKELKEEQSKVSHSLRILYKCHFVTKKSDGKKRIYSVNEKTIKPLMEIVEKHVRFNCDKRCWVR